MCVCVSVVLLLGVQGYGTSARGLKVRGIQYPLPLNSPPPPEYQVFDVDVDPLKAGQPHLNPKPYRP